MKKLLLLGGISYLVPVIKAAKKLGHYVITCDYLPDNVAHKYSDEFHNISILDKERILDLAQRRRIDGIMSFAVDPGVLTAAYVAEVMNLPSPGPYSSIEILQNKDYFREFLGKNGFNVPKSETFTDIEFAIAKFESSDLPVIVKPVDSAGSKGVSRVNSEFELRGAIEYAIRFSSKKRFIIEEFLESKGFASDSDCFSNKGSLEFVSFSNQRFDPDAPNPYTPAGFSWPSDISHSNQLYLESELQRLIKLLDLKSSLYNVETRETLDGKAYLMEVSPRGGGNRLSELLGYSTGVDLITYAVQAALGELVDEIPKCSYNGLWAEVVLYSHVDGIYKSVKVADNVKDAVVEMEIRVKKGERVKALTAANDAIGTIVLKFNDKNTLNQVMAKPSEFFQVITE